MGRCLRKQKSPLIEKCRHLTSISLRKTVSFMLDFFLIFHNTPWCMPSTRLSLQISRSLLFVQAIFLHQRGWLFYLDKLLPLKILGVLLECFFQTYYWQPRKRMLHLSTFLRHLSPQEETLFVSINFLEQSVPTWLENRFSFHCFLKKRCVSWKI